MSLATDSTFHVVSTLIYGFMDVHFSPLLTSLVFCEFSFSLLMGVCWGYTFYLSLLGLENKAEAKNSQRI